VTSDSVESWVSGKRVAYQKQFHDGGGTQFTGPPMQVDDVGDPLDLDYDLHYFCDV